MATTNPSRSERGRYHYVTDCIGAESGKDIRLLVESERRVERRTFAEALGLQAWQDFQTQLGYSLTNDGGLRISNDHAIGYYKGVYRGVRCYFARWSAIEYIYTLDGRQGPSVPASGAATDLRAHRNPAPKATPAGTPKVDGCSPEAVAAITDIFAALVGGRLTEYAAEGGPGGLGPIRLVVDDDTALNGRPEGGRACAASTVDDGVGAVYVTRALVAGGDTDKQTGVLMHELAHVVLMFTGNDDHSERDADALAENIWGVRINYGHDDVQTIGRDRGRAKWPRPKHLEARSNPGRPGGECRANPRLPADLAALRPALVAAAQGVYNEWVVDPNNPDDDELAGGGICHLIADEMLGVLTAAGFDALTTQASVGENHTFVIAQTPHGVWSVDIQPSVYERGSAYSWTKIEGVVFEPDDVDIELIDKDPAAFSEYASDY